MMTADIKYLIVALIGIDFIFFVFFIMLIKRVGHMKRPGTLEREVQLFESLVKDAGELAEKFTRQIQAKQQLIGSLNEQLDQRVASLNLLLNRSDVLMSAGERPESANPQADGSLNARRAEILKLAGSGYKTEDIARRLSLPKGEVALILNLKQQITGLSATRG